MPKCPPPNLAFLKGYYRFTNYFEMLNFLLSDIIAGRIRTS